MNRRFVYLGFVLVAAWLVWWSGREQTPPAGDTWERLDADVPALVHRDALWGPFAYVASRADGAAEIEGLSITAPGCAKGGAELRVLVATSEEGELHVALVPVDEASCPALELLLRPATEGGALARARVLLAGERRGALRNLRGRVTLDEAWRGELPLSLHLRVQGEDAAGEVVTVEATLVVPNS